MEIRSRLRAIIALVSIFKIVLGFYLIIDGSRFGFYFEISDTPIGEFILSFGIVGLITVFC